MIAKQFRVLLTDPFSNSKHSQFIRADSLDEAIRQANELARSERLHLEQVQSPAGPLVSFGSPRYRVKCARVLLRRNQDFIEEFIAALTLSMAVDLAQLMHPDDDVIAVRSGRKTFWLSQAGTESPLPSSWRL